MIDSIEEEYEDRIEQLKAKIEQLKAKNEMLKKIPRCPCNGILKGIGYNIKTEDVIFECVKCKTQLILPDKIWQLILKG